MEKISHKLDKESLISTSQVEPSSKMDMWRRTNECHQKAKMVRDHLKMQETIEMHRRCKLQIMTNCRRDIEMPRIRIQRSDSYLTSIVSTVLALATLLSLTTAISQALAIPSTGNQIIIVDPNTTPNVTTTNLRQQNTILASFATPNQAINITHVTYDPLYDTVYLGATNNIYQLNGSDLSEQHEQSTGPVHDNPLCGITDCVGYEDFMKSTQNVNKVLVIDYQHKKLLSCGSTKQGACTRYQLNNIAQKEDLTPMAVAANDDNSSTYAFIAPARYNLDSEDNSGGIKSQASSQSQQQVLYVASTYTKVGQSRDLLVPSIGTRILEDGPNLLKLYENQFDMARIDINSHLRDYFLVNYLYGFASSNYVYFVTVQKKATSRDYEELGYHTRLARICITDSSYNSYTEVDLKCMPNKRKVAQSSKHPSFFGSLLPQQQQVPSEYPLLQDAILVDAGSHLLQSLAQNDQSSPMSADMFFSGQSSGTPDDNKVLLGVFSSARDHTQHAGDHSAICAFSLSQIEDKFNDNIHNCYTGKMQSRNMEYIAGNVQECPKSGQGGNVVNFCHETLKINGTIPIVSEASIQFTNTTLTAITATSHVNSNSKNIYSEQLASDFSSLPNATLNAFKSGNPSLVTSTAGNANQPNTVVFVGTSTGHVKKVLLNNASAGVEFEDVQLDTNPILSDLHLHSSGQQLIVATPYKVMKVPTHNCAQYTSCRECSQSKNPYCGWCSLRRSCTTKHECVPSGTSEIPNQPQRAPSVMDPSSIAPTASSSRQQQQQQQQLKWISNESAGKCIDLQAIVPDKIPITSTGKVDLHIDRLPRLPKDHSYKCIFDRKEQTTATMMPFGLSCPLPKVMHRPKIQPGRDHAIVDLAVRSSETNTDFLNGKITFFECQLHTTCKDCLTTNWGCNWCLNENICLFNATKCEKTGNNSLVQLTRSTTSSPIVTVSNQRGTSTTVAGANYASTLIASGSSRERTSSGNTISIVQQCPTFDVGHKQDILVADGSERELAIKVKNMPQFKGNIQCVVEVENDKITLKAKIEEDKIICESSTYKYAADVGLLTGHLEVIYSDNNILIDRTNFTMYKCHQLGAYLSRPDCSLCQRIDSRFNCAWCSDSCMHRSACTKAADSSCPAPRIDYVYPLSGPTLGGTRVTIEGSNLGQTFQEIEARVTIGNVPCRPILDEYKPSNKIVCLTSPVVASNQLGSSFYLQQESQGALLLGDVIVGNKAGYSMAPASKFQFKSIYLKDHQPRYGPQSGGTRLTLTGNNLNIGSSVQVFLEELPCIIEQSSLTAEQIICKTTASRQPSRAIRQLKLIIDDAQIVRDDEVFYYTQDPTIQRIQPLRSYLSGGRPINVYGSNLTSVQVPRMAILDSAGKKINESTCILQDETRMQCPSPAINLEMMNLEWSEQQLGQYEPQLFTNLASTPSTTNKLTGSSLQHDESVKFRLSFIMDNVWRLRDLQTSSPKLNSEIAYTSDPKLYPFSSQQYKQSQEAMSQLSSNEQLNSALQQSYQVEADTYLLQPGKPILVLHGDHLGAAVSEFEITVSVGADLCNLTHLSQTKLICQVPLDHMATPTDEEGHQTPRALPLVVVRIGFNLRYELGYVQYHPVLMEQIAQEMAKMDEGQQFALGARSGMHMPSYSRYMPRENESLLSKISSFITGCLTLLLYTTLGSIVLALVYISGVRFLDFRPILASNKRNYFETSDYKRIQAKVDSLEKSVKNECRIASLALASDLNELVRHVEMSGTPVLDMKNYIMKVFFPGINNHPLSRQHGLIQRPPTGEGFPMGYFERLVLTKPFLITFINTLEQQPGFTIRDKVNVASLIMIILMERLDYATDILRTLLFQLVQKSAQVDNADYMSHRSMTMKGKTSLSRRASNLLGGLPITKRATRAANLGKVVGGSATSIMASTQVAAQMLLSRVGNKTSPLQHQHYQDSYMVSSTTLSPQQQQFVSTTAFNNHNSINHTIGGDRHLRKRQAKSSGSSTSSRSGQSKQAHLMLRRTDSVVEKMLTNWLAITMYDHFHGPSGQSLYMMVEALRSQLERGPIDSITGDAFYSLNESKLLRESHLQFEMVNLYVIVSSEIVNAPNHVNGNLLIDSGNNYNPTSSMIYEDAASNRSSHYATNGMTISLRALDCDTISQVKAKILSAIYKNTPASARLGVDDVELFLRLRQQQIPAPSGTGQFVVISLNDEDYSSVTTFNGMRRVNTLRHYGVTDQAIIMLNRVHHPEQSKIATSQRTNLTDMLDEHYNNPYSEIQYAPAKTTCHEQSGTNLMQQIRTSNGTTATKSNGKAWHLISSRSQDDHQNASLVEGSRSNDSSPSSHSPSMMLLGNESSQLKQNQTTRLRLAPNSQQQYHYHPSSSSTSSSANVMDTNSTSANSSSINVTANLMAARQRANPNEQQPIYYQIGSTRGQQATSGSTSNYYCQIGADFQHVNPMEAIHRQQQKHQPCQGQVDREQENQIYLSRMLASKGTIQNYIDDLFASILSAKPTMDGNSTQRPHQEAGSCPQAVKWLFDLLDEAAEENGITDQSVIHSWKSNAFLMRFWMNFIKNPNYILDMDKSNTVDASLSTIAQTLMDSCTNSDLRTGEDSTNKILFSKDVPRYRASVKRFYQDIAAMKPVCDQDMIKRMSSLSMAIAGRFDTNLALKELCVYAVNYGVELMNALNGDYVCQQLDLSRQLEQCFRSFTLFEPYQ